MVRGRTGAYVVALFMYIFTMSVCIHVSIHFFMKLRAPGLPG